MLIIKKSFIISFIKDIFNYKKLKVLYKKMKYKTRQKKIGFIYIAIMLMSLICNTEEKLFYERIKNFLSRKQKIVSYLQADSEYLKDAFKGFFKIGTSVSPNEFNVGSDFIKKHFNSITPENELKPDSIINQQACQSQGNNAYNS